MLRSSWLVQRETGFLFVPDPINDLSSFASILPEAYLGVMQEAGDQLPARHRDADLRDWLRSLPDLDLARLNQATYEPALAQRLMRLYGFLANAYIHAGPKPETLLPANLARPLVALASLENRPPVLAYADMVLGNWHRPDPQSAIGLDNLRATQTFTGLADEEWFYRVHIAIEAAAGTMLYSIENMLDYVDSEYDRGVLRVLREIHNNLVILTRTFHRMPDHCDPDIYYQQIRPFMFGMNGVIFEGVDSLEGQPQDLRGGSGAQSTIIPALLAAMGIDHAETQLTQSLDQMQTYMPTPHRHFIQRMKTSRLRPYAAQRPPLRDAYNNALRQLMTFRRAHLYYARSYIFAKSTNPLGTGGTHYMDFLSQLISETEAQLLPGD